MILTATILTRTADSVAQWHRKREPFRLSLSVVVDFPRTFAPTCRDVWIVVTMVRYVPTWFWGKSGHVQTILYGKMGRVDSPMPRGCRCAKLLADGATMTYDIFQPLGNLKTGGRWILRLISWMMWVIWVICTWSRKVSLQRQLFTGFVLGQHVASLVSEFHIEQVLVLEVNYCHLIEKASWTTST